ncbi:hypothetical protein F2Q70_00013209 [Brassica cretica]|uniref:DNA-directed RNA polymerase n=1 Tax=Brassica cretica TaxID=69181 RepID=A0A8S9MEJ0_BRACR|nr:hypothetical protein F2Q70_00013209 [Brassica cretica]
MDYKQNQTYIDADCKITQENSNKEITQEDAWTVISAYFEEKGLVRQQIDSFDEFIQNTMQEIVDESSDIEIRPESQHNPGHQSDFAEGLPSRRIYKISFGQIYVSKPTITESDGETATLFPKAASMRKQSKDDVSTIKRSSKSLSEFLNTLKRKKDVESVGVYHFPMGFLTETSVGKTGFSGTMKSSP